VTAETALAIIGAGVPRYAMADTVLAGYVALLREDRCFAHLSWSDAERVARMIAEALTHPGPAARMRNMARDAGAGIGAWMNPTAVSRAFSIAAAALS
jgi:hypothetical protein